MMWGYDGFGFGGMGLGMLLFWGLVIFGVVMLVRGFGHAGGSDPSWSAHQKSAMDILRERYARGEIDRNEFEQKRGDLERPAAKPPV